MSLTVAIAAYMYDLGHDAHQLGCLENQTVRDFDLIFIDPYQDKARKALVTEWSERTGIPATYVPYALPPMPRKFDWAIWNTPFLLTEAKRVWRCQQWRFFTRNTVERILSTTGNVGFFRYQVQDESHRTHHDCPHNQCVWDGELEFDTKYTIMPSGHQTVEVRPAPIAVYGDWCLTVEDFIATNGIDEANTALCHYEDIDMEMRWGISSRLGITKPVTCFHRMAYRVDEPLRKSIVRDEEQEQDAESIRRRRVEDITGAWYGSYKMRRRNIKGWKDCCKECSQAFSDISEGKPTNATCLGMNNGQEWWQCQCGGVFHKQSHPHFTEMRQAMETGDHYRATINVAGFGRNLLTLRQDCMKIDMAARIDLVNTSWANPRYLR